MHKCNIYKKGKFIYLDHKLRLHGYSNFNVDYIDIRISIFKNLHNIIDMRLYNSIVWRNEIIEGYFKQKSK